MYCRVFARCHPWTYQAFMLYATQGVKIKVWTGRRKTSGFVSTFASGAGHGKVCFDVCQGFIPMQRTHVGRCNSQNLKSTKGPDVEIIRGTDRDGVLASCFPLLLSCSPALLLLPFLNRGSFWRFLLTGALDRFLVVGFELRSSVNGVQQIMHVMDILNTSRKNVLSGTWW